MARQHNREFKPKDQYYQDKLAYHFDKIVWEINQLHELGIEVDIDKFCQALKDRTQRGGKAAAWLVNDNDNAITVQAIER